jgi:hypothetical protein
MRKLTALDLKSSYQLDVQIPPQYIKHSDAFGKSHFTSILTKLKN